MSLQDILGKLWEKLCDVRADVNRDERDIFYMVDIYRKGYLIQRKKEQYGNLPAAVNQARTEVLGEKSRCESSQRDYSTVQAVVTEFKGKKSKTPSATEMSYIIRALYPNVLIERRHYAEGRKINIDDVINRK